MNSPNPDSSTGPARIFDAWINIPYAAGEVTPDPTVTARFKRSNSAYEGGETMDDVITEMDRLGIGAGVLTRVPRDITPPFIPGIKGSDEVFHSTCTQVAELVAKYPGRFIGSVGLDPRLGYAAAVQVRIAAEQYGINVVRILPMFTGIDIDDKLGYPLYTAVTDNGGVVTINVGVPGPMKPARLQRTILVDEVALCFPDLKIVMSHVGDPWLGETISMLTKHPNVYLMTAGWAPKYLPIPLLEFMGSRGRTKVMWASDYPILPMERTLTEGRALSLRDAGKPGYLGENGYAVFGTPQGPDPTPPVTNTLQHESRGT